MKPYLTLPTAMFFRFGRHLDPEQSRRGESKDPFLRKHKGNGFLHSLRSVEMTRVRNCMTLLLAAVLLLTLVGCQPEPVETLPSTAPTASAETTAPPTTEAPTVAPEATETTAPPETRPANMTDLH